MRRASKLLASLLLVVVIPLLFGCWDQQEITNLAAITGIGFDIASDPRLVLVSVQISPPSPGGVAGGGGGIGGTRLRVLTIEVEAPSDFLTLLQGHTRRQPFFQHLAFVVFGEDFARAQGIDRVLSGLQGIPEVRGSVPAFVCVGPAEEILKARSGIGRIPGQDIQDILTNLRNAPLGTSVTLNEVMTILGNEGRELSLPILELTPLRLEAGDEAPETGLGQDDEELQEVILSRVALFSGDRWVVDLDPLVTQMFILLTGDVRKGGITFPNPADPDGYVAVQYQDFRPSFKPILEGDRVKLQLDITIKARIVEIRGEYDIRTLGFDPLSSALQNVVSEQALDIIQQLQSEGLDSLGVGQAIYRRMPRAWSNLEPVWGDVYPTIPVTVSAKSEVVSTSLIAKFFQMNR